MPPQAIPSEPATKEPSSTPSLAASRRYSSVKASMPMKIDMVNPIPASSPTNQTPPQVMPAGNRQTPRRTNTQLASITPSGLPATSASATLNMIHIDASVENSMPPKAIPALARANNGMIP